MNDNQRPLDQRLLVKAADHLRAAINLLDRSGAAGHIAAHVDLALNEAQRLMDAGARLPRSSIFESGHSGIAGLSESE